MRQITPTNHDGTIQLKFSFSGKRYSFNPIPGGQYECTRDLATARSIAVQIQNDILAGYFDTSLNKYRLNHKKPDPIPKEVDPLKNLLDLWDRWVEHLVLSASTKNHHYKTIRNQIAKINPRIAEITWLIESNLSPSTFNQRLGYLNSCLNWGVLSGLVSVNPYEKIKTRRVVVTEIKPFSLEEIRLILEGFDKVAPHYTPFVKILFTTGVRISEAIGLKWQHIDFDRGHISITESLSRDWSGNGYSRTRRSTKSKGRILPMNEPIRDLLSSIKTSAVTPEDLVFTSIEGLPIDDGNFRNRYWVKVLQMQKIPYRHPYTTRHTMISHGLEQGTSLAGLAYLAGHANTQMIIKNYAHMVNRPLLPDLFS